MEDAALNSTFGGSSLPNDDIIPATIPDVSLVNDATSQVTQLVVASSVATQAQLSATELGLPSTSFKIDKFEGIFSYFSP